MHPAFPKTHIERFVETLVSTGGWLDEVTVGISTELAHQRHPCCLRANSRDVVLEELARTIAPALESIDPEEVARAIELMELVVAPVEQRLKPLRVAADFLDR